MRLLSGLSEQITKILSGGGFGQKQEFALTAPDFWEHWDLKRRGSSNRIFYDSNSAFQAYRAHELVYACINKIADVMNDAEIIVEKKTSKGDWEKAEGHLLTGLFRRPNREQTGRDLRRLLVQSEQGVGRFCLFIDRSAAGIPVSLTALNPVKIRAEYDRSRDRILFYEYTRKDGRKVKIATEDLIIRRRPDLLDQYHGFAPLEAALKSVNSDLGLTDYVDAFFESDGTPSGILKILNATVNQTKREAMQRDWKRKYSRGGTNQKGVAVLDQNADYQKIGSNLDELDSESLTGRFESRICAVFGVPPNLVGAYVGLVHVTANATAKAELQNFWINKCSPELAALREWLTWFVLPEFEPIEKIQAEQIRVGLDISQAAFLQDEIDNIHKRTREDFKAGLIKLNEAREALGLAPDLEAKNDYYVQPSTLIAISPERRAEEAESEPVIPPALDPALPPAKDPDEDDEKDPADENAKALKEFLEKKTFDLDGLTLRREPTELEILIDLKAIAADLASEKEKVASILASFRLELIDQAAEKLEDLEPKDAYTLTLEPDQKTRAAILKVIKAAFGRGRAQIARELRAQRNAGKAAKAEIDADDLEFLDELTDGLISRMINKIGADAVAEFLKLKLLGNYTADILTEILVATSEKFIDAIAGATTNAAIQAGRASEGEARSSEWDRVIYSAILDANTCEPCGDADGLEAQDPADLPAAPNPDCAGGDRCRCFHVYVSAAEG